MTGSCRSAGNPKPLVLGLTGPNASGKGEVLEFLRTLGFACHSLSDAVREAALARGRTTGRDDLIATGNELRREGGSGVLAERVLLRLGTRDVVDSIRNPGEVRALRTLPYFLLLGVWAPVETRYARARARSGRGDSLASLEAFASKEAEENSLDPAAQQLQATFDMADRVLVNDCRIEAFKLRIWMLLQEIGG